ncbi:MAG TPA: ABC transporter permease [Candidatus Acidoferrales bacterium]|nr:ABC transporter permease [Candidatus Acidoferrales bacterium]
MIARPELRGWTRHFLLTIELSFRNPQGIVYGYLVPVIFLLAFGGVFRSGNPPLLAQMGQIMTITILGGACFGLPTALVAEREQGIWRRYRLLPVATSWLILSAMLARVLIVASSVLVQIALARAIFGTPLPTHPAAVTLAFLFVTAAFLGIGFVIAGLADGVPAVQALGQCIFLPMIMMGGVGVPLTVLPDWAQRIAGFMPGRYAVEVLQSCFSSASGLYGAGFRFAALAVIGLAAGISGAKLFRWEAGRRPGSSRRWVAAALTSWAAVGAIAWATGQSKPVLAEGPAWSSITEAQIATIGFSGLPADTDIVAALAPPDMDLSHTWEFAGRLASWPQAKLDDAGQSIRNLVSVAAVADLCADPREWEIARLVLLQIEGRFEPEVARQALAWIILSPEDGEVVTKASDLGLFRHPPEQLVRGRSVIYAKKYLGRLLGKIPD